MSTEPERAAQVFRYSRIRSLLPCAGILAFVVVVFLLPASVALRWGMGAVGVVAVGLAVETWSIRLTVTAREVRRDGIVAHRVVSLGPHSRVEKYRRPVVVRGIRLPDDVILEVFQGPGGPSVAMALRAVAPSAAQAMETALRQAVREARASDDGAHPEQDLGPR